MAAAVVTARTTITAVLRQRALRLVGTLTPEGLNECNENVLKWLTLMSKIFLFALGS